MRASAGWRALAAVVIAGVLLPGCGGGGDAATTDEPPRLEIQELSMTLDSHLGPQNVPVAIATQRGYFYDLGIYVSANSPLSPVNPVQYVRTGVDDIGISHQPEIDLARDEGTPLVVLGTLISQPTMAMIWLKKAEIDGIADLRGKTIAIPGLPFQERFLGQILGRAGLTLRDVTVRRVRYELVPNLVTGRVDAIFGGSWNLEGVELESRGFEPVITPVEQLGIPPYDEYVIFARADFVEERPRLIRDFMAALSRGADAAIDNPRAAFEAIKASNDLNRETSDRALRAQLEATLPLLSEDLCCGP